MRLRFDEIGWQAGGRQLELIEEDSRAEPSVGVDKARSLVERDRIEILVGPISSGVAFAIQPFLLEQGIPSLLPIDGELDLTLNDLTFRTSFVVDQHDYWLGRYAAEKLGYRTACALGSDYVFGHNAVAAFEAGFTEAGGEVIHTAFPALGTTDYAPFLIVLPEAEACYVFFAGSDAVRFVQQWAEFGLKERIQLLGHGDYVDNTVLPAEGEAAVGLLSSFHWFPSLDLEANERFMAAYREAYGEEPSAFAAHGYVSAQVIEQALERLEGREASGRELAGALEGVRFDAPWGPFAFFGETNTPVFDVYILEVVRQDGEIRQALRDTIPGVEPLPRVTGSGQ